MGLTWPLGKAVCPPDMRAENRYSRGYAVHSFISLREAARMRADSRLPVKHSYQKLCYLSKRVERVRRN